MKKHWLTLIIIIILVIGYFIIKGTDKVEYAELRDEPHLKGNPEASVVLVVYSDFQCLDCSPIFSFIEDLLKEYQDKIKFEYRHFSTGGASGSVFRAAEASECAADQEKFWEYHDLLFANQDNLTKSNLVNYAESVEGLDLELWQDCLNSDIKARRVEDDYNEATRSGYKTTPTFVLNGQKIDDGQRLPEMIKALLEPLESLQKEATTTQSYLRKVRLSS